ncbi:hypothetical protein M8J75_008657 [Diaphorina citri]|nr:hypothetical protein M8J75_008657 [Diaphorina citri]
MASQNPYEHLKKTLNIGEKTYNYYDLPGLGQSYVRNCDEFQVKKSHVENILKWEENQRLEGGVEVPFKPARVILQDLTGVPAVVDFAAMRDAVKSLNGDPQKINPICPSDLVIDHSVQVDFSRSSSALEKNENIEFQRNGERFNGEPRHFATC